MQALYLIFHFIIATVRKFKEETVEISFDNIFSSTQSVQNIKISTFNQCRKLLTNYLHSLKWCCILHSQHISVQTNYTPNVQQPHMTNGYSNRQQKAYALLLHLREVQNNDLLYELNALCFANISKSVTSFVTHSVSTMSQVG